MLINLNNKNVSGKLAAVALEKAGMVLNYNTVPGETRKASDPSGIRLGTPSVTSRGFGPAEMEKIADWMDRTLQAADDEDELKRINAEVTALCAKFPVPGLD
jgi:glycine hydroxymethyltransferase